MPSLAVFNDRPEVMPVGVDEEELERDEEENEADHLRHHRQVKEQDDDQRWTEQRQCDTDVTIYK